MFNLNDILQAAQGGNAVSNLATQFGITPEQAQAAMKAMLPGISAGLQNQAQDASGLGGIINALTHGAHQASYQDPQAAQAPGTAAAGGDILGQIFGSSGVTEKLAQAAAGQTGLPHNVLMQMMPVIASMIMGGMFSSMQKQGMGGLLNQLQQAAASHGGLGSILGQMMGGQQPGAAQPAAAGGGLGGLLGGLFGGLMGGGAATAQPQGMPGGLTAPAVQAGIDALTKMMHPGMQMGTTQQQMIENILGQFIKPAGR